MCFSVAISITARCSIDEQFEYFLSNSGTVLGTCSSIEKSKIVIQNEHKQIVPTVIFYFFFEKE